MADTGWGSRKGHSLGDDSLRKEKVTTHQFKVSIADAKKNI